MRNTPGTTLTEVMVMMVILGISLVGIFSLVNNGQKLAALSDTRLVGVNIAREGLESVTTLRDTFALASFTSGTCNDVVIGSTGAFFTIDGHQILDIVGPGDNCPILTANPGVITSDKYYTLLDDNILEYKAANAEGETEICVNKFGWYSQEFSDTNNKTLAVCRPDPSGQGCTVCATTPTSCAAGTTRNCKTKFKRKITFEQCKDGGGVLVDTLYCVVVRSTVWWGTASDEKISLFQILTTRS